ncbi:hypothetical protein J421_5700 (plasmid) [Gemmatirosa kalamazoonensis]|uniref:Uncharacterized protein n=1 Tax=Gemmatirosa kalamazoonensis TaxID=861299 RepID=W0RSG6_9BACT|nr:hypothetical protein [Gemmatirosa kalamazoonensis]AHG93235.1 hypothetical protein J421_5700 [Gemmatirosa kalamazoonensis]
MRSGTIARALVLASLAPPLAGPGAERVVRDSSTAGPATVSVFVGTRRATPLAPALAGYNVALMGVALTYTDRDLAAAARRLSPGWLRYPAGTRGEAFDWRTGRSHQAWVDAVTGTVGPADRPFFRDMLQSALVALEAKGGERVDDAAAFARAAGARGLVVCVNVYSDTPASAGDFAGYARAHDIRVLAWELGNEPYFNRRRFATGAAYAAAMRPFAEAIRRADPTATVAVSMSDAGFQDHAWDDALGAFRPRYWDAVVYHHYPTVSGAPARMMAALNGVLADNTSAYVEREVRPRFGAMPVMITESGPQDGPAPGMSGTLYGGIWSAEYALRVSGLPQVTRFGVHQLVGPAGVVGGEATGVSARRGALTTSAQGAAYAVAASAINSASGVYATHVEGGGTVRRDGDHGADMAMPAVYAQAYRRRDGDAVVVTNKGPRAEVLALVVDGRAVASSLRVLTVTGPSPTASNRPGRERVTATTSVASRTVRIPPYAVVEIVWGAARGIDKTR